jgi:hypothetical protein
METFLVEIRVRVSDYGGKEEKFTTMRLVRAHDKEEAETKAEHYFERKTVEYETYYHANAVVYDTIE